MLFQADVSSWQDQEAHVLYSNLSFAIDLICEFLKKAHSGVQCSRKAQQGVT
jgi:hypothetical protein